MRRRMREREGGGKHGRPTTCFELGSDQNIAILVNSEDCSIENYKPITP